MVESQPGTVTSFDPSVSLSNFSANTRDHLIFNENQLVLAKVQQTQPTSAYAYSRSTSGITAFEEYKNTSGEYVYIDGSYQALTTEGVPTSDVHRIVVGFDQQISTNTVVFWSTSYVDTSLVFMEYSFDNATWFSVGAVTWAYLFDDTIQINPTDDPPTGEYKYTGTFDGGSITARYWRIRSDAEVEWLSGTAATLTVDSTSYFPSTSSDVKVFSDSGTYRATFGYTGKTGTTFTGRSPTTFTDFAPEDKIVNLDDPFGNGVTEIQIIPTADPILQHWNSDGSQAVSVELEGSNYYHLAYDKTDDVYYALRLDHDLEGNTPDPHDNFDEDTGTAFDSILWAEDTVNIYFTHNTASGTLDYKSSGGSGQLETTYGLDGVFNANIELVALVKLNNADGFFGIESKGYDSGNEYVVSALKGPYLPDNRGDTAAEYVFEAAADTENDWRRTVYLQSGYGWGWATDIDGFRIVTSRPSGYYDYGFVRIQDIDPDAVASAGHIVSEILGVPSGDATGFGGSVSVSGDLLVVGAPYANDQASNSGVAYVFIKSSDTWWVEEARILPSTNNIGIRFGHSVATDGTRIYVGSYTGNAVWVYERVSGVWTETDKLEADDTSYNLGQSLACEGDTVIAGDPENKPSDVYQAGAVYAFLYSGGSWSQQDKLVPSDIVAGNKFGTSLALSGETAVIGLPYDDDFALDAGSVYVFDRSGASWSQTQKILGELSRDYFGYDVDIEGTTIIVGAPSNSMVGREGTVYMYEYSGTWSQSAKISYDNYSDSMGKKVGISGDLAVSVGYYWGGGIEDERSSEFIYQRIGSSGWVEMSKAEASDTIDGVGLGFSVATTSGISIVGVPTSEDNGEASGDAYVFEVDAGTSAWVESAQLLPADPSTDHQFGYSVAVSNTTAAVAAVGDTDEGVAAGAVYIFERSGSSWPQDTKITVSGVDAGDMFGYDLALDGDTLVVGAPYDDSAAGAAYVFDRDGGAWSLEAKIYGAGAAAWDMFGTSVAVYGDKVAVGAPYNDDDGADSGSVYIFDRDGGAWAQEKQLTASGAGDEFGSAVALHYGYLVVGSPKEGSAASDSGAVYVYENSGSAWSLMGGALYPNDPEISANFGSSVSVWENRLVAGTPFKTGSAGTSDAGAAYLFEFDASVWGQAAKLEASDGSAGDRFGHSVATASGVVMVGNYYPVPDARWAGATIEYTDTVAGAAELQDFRIHPDSFDFSVDSGELVYTITYVESSDSYTVSISGDSSSYSDAVPGIEYVLNSSTAKVSFLIANLTAPADGTGFTVTVRFSQNAVGDQTTTSGLAVEVMRLGTNSYARYREAAEPLFASSHTGNIPSGERQRLQLFADAASDSVDIGADNMTVTGTLYYDSPVLSLVTLNKDGEMEQVSGVSDTEGYAIKRFDIIKDVRAEYNDYMTPVTGVATNAGTGSGGEIYVKVNDALYKYLKSDLPLDLEEGVSASVSTEGEIPSTGITGFAYNGYSGGGLSYIEYIADLSGTFVKTIATTTLTAVTKKAMLDVASINYPFTWNVSDLSTLYFVDGTVLKLYDMNEAKAAFVNVTSDKQVLAAGTAETATVTAQVLNVYGEPKSTKTMTFTVSAGDGALSPATGCSDVNGEDDSTYTVGSAVGTATITVTVSDSICS